MAAQLPTPSGTQPQPLGMLPQYTLAQYAAQFDAKFPGKGAGNAFLAYAAASPNLTPKQASSAFALMIAVEGVDKAIAAALAGSAGLIGAATKIQGLNPFQGWVTGFLGAFTNRNTWIRVAEVVSGLILLGIGLNALLKGKPMQAVTRTAGLAAKAVPA